jgi:hypothetical protein
MWAMVTRWPDPVQRFIIIHGLLGLRSSTVAWQDVKLISAVPKALYWPTNADTFKLNFCLKLVIFECLKHENYAERHG